MKKHRFPLLLAALMVFVLVMVFLAGCGGGQGSPAQQTGQSQPAPQKEAPKAPDFPTKDITFIVPYSPGGGFDTYARILTPYMQKYLPNNPNVIVKNTPGADGKMGIMEVYRAKSDGHTIGIFNMPGNAVAQVLGEKDFDLTKIEWLGKLTDAEYFGALSPKSSYKSLEDLQKSDKEVIAGIVGLSTTAGLGMVVAADAMGYKIKTVMHDGSQEAILSAIRGDVDWVQYPWPTMKKFVVDSQELVPLVSFSNQRQPELPDTPTVIELGYPELMDLVGIRYLIGAAPDTPQEIVAILAKALKDSVDDPGLQADLKKANAPVAYFTPEQAAKSVQNALEALEPYKNTLAEARK